MFTDSDYLFLKTSSTDRFWSETQIKDPVGYSSVLKPCLNLFNKNEVRTLMVRNGYTGKDSGLVVYGEQEVPS